MSNDAYEVFRADALARGYNEVLVREWSPGQVLDTHSHPFEVHARVVRGGLVLVCGGQRRELKAGDSFELPRGEPHAEHYGSEGATFWVARRHAI